MGWIKNRIDAEFKKHKDLDWSRIAEAKITETLKKKENRLIPSVHESIESIFLKRNPQCNLEELLWRADQRLEWHCKHGIGHTIFSPDFDNEGPHWIHGCDGCCKDKILLEIKFRIPKKNGLSKT